MYTYLFAQDGGGGDSGGDNLDMVTNMAIEYGIPVAKALVTGLIDI